MNRDVEQKIIKPRGGMAVLILTTMLLILFIIGIIAGAIFLDRGDSLVGGILLGVCITGVVATPVLYFGLKIVGPNEALVLTLFGKYYGTIMESGFYFVNPFTCSNNPAYTKALNTKVLSNKMENAENLRKDTASAAPKINAKKTVSLKDITLNNGVQKVNDVMGNPIVIGAVVIWRVVNPTKAVFNVEDYSEFLSIQTDSTIRNTARLYPYDFAESDIRSDENNEKTLRGSSQEIAETMRKALAEKVEFAGLEIVEVRITHLAYAEEIAAAMLKRQQASAVIAARAKIVEGAVGMVKMAIDKLSEEEMVFLDEERKAAMVSNLMVVLCSEKDTQPVINSGSIY